MRFREENDQRLITRSVDFGLYTWSRGAWGNWPVFARLLVPLLFGFRLPVALRSSGLLIAFHIYYRSWNNILCILIKRE